MFCPALLCYRISDFVRAELSGPVILAGPFGQQGAPIFGNPHYMTLQNPNKP